MSTQPKYLRRKEVEAITGFSCSTLYRLMRIGQFPLPLQIGPRAVRWVESEIMEFLDSRLRATGEFAQTG